MSKFTRRFKKNKKNRTNKVGGSSDFSQNQNMPEDLQRKHREGVIDMISNNISGVVSSAATAIGDVGLRIVGLERINKNATENIDENTNNSGSSGIISNVGNVADKLGAVAVENVNEVLGSNIVQESTEQAAEKTAEIVEETAEKFNEALDKPEIKAEVEESIEKAAEIGTIVVEASEKPLNAAVDVASKAASKAAGATIAGIGKVATDALGAVPFLGAVVDAGKMVNDGSKAVSSVVEAGSEAIEAASDAFIETKKNVENSLDMLEQQKKIGQQVSNRTNNSINEFEQPTTINNQVAQGAGAKKTRRKLFKHKAKSKRVRFAI